MRARRTPITDAVADTAWDGASDDYAPYAKMLANARELEEKLQTECRSTMKLTNELLDVKLELAVATKQRDALLESLESACAYPLTDSWFEKAQTAIASVKGSTP